MAELSSEIATNIGGQLRDFYGKMTNKQKIILLAAVALVLIIISASIYFTSRTTWVTLFSGLNSKETSQIITRLDEVQIPYQISPGGGGVLVPIEKADTAKLDVANSDVLSNGVVGLEIFNSSSFTMTEFQQNVQLRRAMEGELSRLITLINAVDAAKVILAIPEKSVFIKDTDAPTAAVNLVLANSTPLDSRVVKTILNLVSSGVPGLKIENVKISDQFGNLYTNDLKDSRYENEDKNFQYKHNIEKYLENKVIDQLNDVAGREGIKVKVSAEINTEVQKIEENLVDPDLTAVVSEQTISEKASGTRTLPIGVPGVTSNSPEINAGINEAANTGQSDKRTKQTNYENSRRLIQREISSGGITRLTVSVLLDDKTTLAATAGLANGANETTRVKWTEAELAEISAIVRSSVGFNEQRGDQIEVKNIAFSTSIEQRIKVNNETSIVQSEFIFNIVRYAMAGLISFLLIFFVIRPLIKRIAPKPDQADYSGLDLTGILPDDDFSGSANDDASNGTSTRPREITPQEILDNARNNPAETIQTIRSWLKEA